jgi:phenylalanyl-tRNA synthetase beta chain
MKVPLRWLAEFVELTLPPEELAERMTFAGLEVSSVRKVGDFWDRETVLVGEIVKVEPHPNADRLTLPTVAYGNGRTIRLVTGAPNIRVGMSGPKVPLALVGSRLVDAYSPGGGFLVLKPAKLRGVESAGMVCSERELGISEEHGGIMILPDDAPTGTPLADYLGETVLEVEPTPNMSRCLSILGVAREVAALTGRPVTYRPTPPASGARSAADLMGIAIHREDLCARYCGTYIGGVTIGPSPFVTRHRLTLAGVRAISNVVDATNYLMLELGQPLHAFDYAVLRERAGGGLPEVIVRTAREGETIVTLDGVERRCTADTLLITDRRGPIAVAGVMGGEETEVREGTREILLEAATFNHASIRRTAQRFRLPSQASLRFGKGLPASLAGEASARATELIARLTGGEAAAGVVDCHPRPQPAVVVRADLRDFSRTLGYHLPDHRIQGILEDLGFGVEEDGGRLTVAVPPWRLDVSIPADLVEEVARVEGYDKLPTTLLREYLPPQERNPVLEGEAEVKDLLVAGGLDEVIPYSLVEESRAAAWRDLAEPGSLRARGGFLRLANPLSEDRTVKRMDLTPGLLETLVTNRRNRRRVAVFETGRVFHRREAGLPDEPRRLGILLWGLRHEPWWGAPEPPVMDFFDLKGVVTGLLERLCLTDVALTPSSRAVLQPGRGVELAAGGVPLGWMGELHPSVRRAWDLGEERVAVAELDLEAVISRRGAPVFRSPARFPAVTQDLALVVDQDLPAGEVMGVIGAAGGDLLVATTLFDVYRGPQVPEGKKSLAFSLVFQSAERTLTEEEASSRREAVVAALAARFGASLR